MVAVELVTRVWFDLGQLFMVEVRTVAQGWIWTRGKYDRRTGSIFCK